MKAVKIELSYEAADDVFKNMLLHWYDVFTTPPHPKHPEDIQRQKEWLDAVLVFMDFYEIPVPRKKDPVGRHAVPGQSRTLRGGTRSGHSFRSDTN